MLCGWEAVVNYHLREFNNGPEFSIIVGFAESDRGSLGSRCWKLGSEVCKSLGLRAQSGSGGRRAETPGDLQVHHLTIHTALPSMDLARRFRYHSHFVE